MSYIQLPGGLKKKCWKDAAEFAKRSESKRSFEILAVSCQSKRSNISK